MAARRVDDRDSSVTYSTNVAWRQAGGREEYEQTTTWTTAAGATATIRFTGSRIVVYGSVTDAGQLGIPRSSYSLDGGSRSFYTASPAETVQYGVPFYDSETLPSGEHTLVITTEADRAYFWLDYFEITPGEDLPDSSTVESRTVTAVTVAVAQTSIEPVFESPWLTIASLESQQSFSQIASQSSGGPYTVYVTIPATNETVNTGEGDNNLQPSKAPGFPMPAAFGLVFGVLALVAITSLFVFIRKRRRKRKAAGLQAPPAQATGGEGTVDGTSLLSALPPCNAQLTRAPTIPGPVTGSLTYPTAFPVYPAGSEASGVPFSKERLVGLQTASDAASTSLSAARPSTSQSGYLPEQTAQGTSTGLIQEEPRFVEPITPIPNYSRMQSVPPRYGEV